METELLIHSIMFVHGFSKGASPLWSYGSMLDWPGDNGGWLGLDGQFQRKPKVFDFPGICDLLDNTLGGPRLLEISKTKGFRTQVETSLFVVEKLPLISN